MSNIFKLKLTALGHPNPEGFNCEGKLMPVCTQTCEFFNLLMYLSIWI